MAPRIKNPDPPKSEDNLDALKSPSFRFIKEIFNK
jgi:hypothetical protein